MRSRKRGVSKEILMVERLKFEEKRIYRYKIVKKKGNYNGKTIYNY